MADIEADVTTREEVVTEVVEAEVVGAVEGVGVEGVSRSGQQGLVAMELRTT